MTQAEMHGPEYDRLREEMARAYFERVSALAARMGAQAEEVGRAREALLPSGARLGERSGHGERDRMADGVARVQDAVDAMEEAAAGWADEAEEARRVLGSMPDQRLAALLQMRHLCRMRWDEVARELNVSLATAHRWHAAALAQAYDGLPPGERLPRHPAI